MDRWPRRISLWRKPRYVPLRYRLIMLSSGMVTLLLLAVILVVGHHENTAIRKHLESRGLAIAHSLAATSKAALTTYDYIALTQYVNQAAQNPDLAYVVIHDKEGRVAGYSGRPDLEGRFLNDPLSQRAVFISEPLVQTGILEHEKTPILDIAVPVTISGSSRPWGVVRVALSLAPMYRQIRQVLITLAVIGMMALALAILVCILTARRITNPLGLLVDATVSAAQGNLNQEINIETGDEVEILAGTFSVMIREILLQRGQLEQQLSEITNLQRYMNKLLTTMHDGLISVDMAGNIATMNPAACAMLKIYAGELDAEPAFSSVLKGAPGLVEYVRSAIESPYSSRQQELQVAFEQELKEIIVVSSVLPGKSDNPEQIIINLHDITALKNLESRMRQAERLAALGTLSAGMAHEIRNPLSAIKTFVQLLPNKQGKPGFMEKFQRTVPRELERINRLIGDLLELARSPRYQLAVVNIGPILQHAVELFDEELMSHSIICRCDIGSELPLIMADTDQLLKAFNNIIKNAIQAMPSGGELYIDTCGNNVQHGSLSAGKESQNMRNSWVSLAFTDSGTGIGSEEIKQIFNPFFTKKETGTGLGLAITHKVITDHGGHIEVDSTPGQGTRFTVHLPAYLVANVALATI